MGMVTHPPTSHRYLHGHHEAVLRSHRQRTAESSAAYLLPHLEPDAEVLDVGCGPGTITVGLAERVPDGTVVGVDAEPTMVGFGSGHPKSLRTLANFMTSRRGLPFTGVKS